MIQLIQGENQGLKIAMAAFPQQSKWVQMIPKNVILTSTPLILRGAGDTALSAHESFEDMLKFVPGALCAKKSKETFLG